MELIKVENNCPLPRGGSFKEVRTYQDESGNIATKTIKIPYFKGKYSDWAEYVDSLPFDK
jgi:hypothetical protein